MNEISREGKAALLIGALGVVYGDIGTSPLYALRECFTAPHGVEPSAHHVLGVISLVVWVLTCIVSIKYIGFVLRAHNRGEGGILALLALVQQGSPAWAKRRLGLLLLLGVFGAALLYGDGMITPAITVLGAVEGLEVATPLFKPWVLPIAVLVLVLLFSFQKHGTGRIGSVFGPVMLVWFVVLGLLGIRGIWHAPQILLALSPHYAVGFLLQNTRQAFTVLGAVFLAVTGAEALYADMGHFGPHPIRRAWFGVVFPALLLNYFGQGALVLNDPAAVKNPFYLLAPDWAVYGLVLLATFAAVIASQALISGAYSLTMQAIQMGLLPRISIRHTSHATIGQIYIPQVNWVLMIACVGLVLSFESSSRLAGAYGIAVSLTMLITTILFYAAARWLWRWPIWLAILVCICFFALELTFAAANSLKLLQGGWFPLAVGTLLCTIMMTWRTGRRILRDRMADNQLPFELFLQDLATHPIQRVPGTAVFLSGNPRGTPIALLHNLKHNKVLHQHIIILTIVALDIPYVPEKERLEVKHPREDIHRVIGRYGFMEQADVPRLLASARSQNLPFDMQTTTFFLSRETIIPGHAHHMALWRRRLFSALSRNAQPVTAFFKLPANRVVELGMQIEL